MSATKDPANLEDMSRSFASTKLTSLERAPWHLMYFKTIFKKRGM